MKFKLYRFEPPNVRMAIEAESEAERYQMAGLIEWLKNSGAVVDLWNDGERSGITVHLKADELP